MFTNFKWILSKYPDDNWLIALLTLLFLALADELEKFLVEVLTETLIQKTKVTACE